MAWRSSFGATVLLALVALHSSTLIELASSEQFNENRERLEQTDISPAAEPVRLTLENMLGLDQIETKTDIKKTADPPLWAALLDLWQQDATNCGGDFLSILEIWYRQFETLLESEQLSAIRNWKDTCYSRLEEKIQSELKAMSESTREQFELFVKQDDYRSKDKFLIVPFPSTNLAIGKLRRLIGSPDGTVSANHLELAERFMSACKEMVANRSIMRANYARETPASRQLYFPHIRFYDDCSRLLDFLRDKRAIEGLLKPPKQIEIFGEKLDKILVGWSKADPETKWDETAESDGERERAVAKAAYQFAKADIHGNIKVLLHSLKRLCSIAVADLGHGIWLHLHLLRHRHSDQRILVLERYSRYLEACKQLGKLEDEQIIKKAREKRGYNLPNLSTCFGCSSAKTNR
jgi:hypothetical protein